MEGGSSDAPWKQPLLARDARPQEAPYSPPADAAGPSRSGDLLAARPHQSRARVLSDDRQGTDMYDDASDTDRWASEKDEGEARREAEVRKSPRSQAERRNRESEDYARGRPSDEYGQEPPREPAAVVGASQSTPNGVGLGVDSQAVAEPVPARTQPRRPNPWEHNNRKTFKPIITIGKHHDVVAGRTLAMRSSRPRRDPDSGPLAHSDLRSAFRCTSLCVGAAIDVREVYVHYQARGIAATAYKDGLNVVTHCFHHNQDDESDAHAFYFTYGVVVLWNFEPHAEQRLIMEAREAFTRGPLEDPEVDDFLYVYDANKPDAKSHIYKDVIHLTSPDVMEKLAVAFGLAQSAKLGVFERVTEATIQNTRAIPEQLAQSGKISLSRKEISMRVGQLFVDRSMVNLHSDMLDTPDFFWEDDEWEPLYQRAAKYLEIEKRVSVLNHRLDIIKDLFEMLSNEMHAKHATNLEVIVIALILLECLFQIMELMQVQLFG